MSAVHVSCTGSVELRAGATRSATYLVFMLNKQLLANAGNFVFFQRRVKWLAWQTREGQTVTGKTDSGSEHKRVHYCFQTIRLPEWCQQKFGLFKWKCSAHHLTKYTDIYSFIFLCYSSVSPLLRSVIAPRDRWVGATVRNQKEKITTFHLVINQNSLILGAI